MKGSSYGLLIYQRTATRINQDGIEIGDALEGAVDGPALAIVGAGGHEVRAVAGMKDLHQGLWRHSN